MEASPLLEEHIFVAIILALLQLYFRLRQEVELKLMVVEMER